MRAAVTPRYGSADVLETREVAVPAVGPHDVLVRVHASPVTAGDLRLRAADFPSFSALLGRFAIGVSRPRHAVQGTAFAGRVVRVGAAVTRFREGDDVFGSVMHGAYAEYLVTPESSAIARTTLPYSVAAALPYGALTALRFLRDIARVKPGERVLILGASGGVGRFAVQLAKHLGAEVTGVSSARHASLVRELGADHVTRADERYDVIFDVAGLSTFGKSRGSLTPNGRYLTLMLSVGVLMRVLVTALLGGPRAKFAIAMGTQRDMEEIAALAEQGAIRPIIARTFPLAEIANAHREAEGRPGGAVLLQMSDGG